MKSNFTFLKASLVVLLLAIGFKAAAQTPSIPLTSTSAIPVAGDGTTVLCSGTKIKLTGPTTGGPYIYHWWKSDNANNFTEVKVSTSGDNVYEEQPGASDAGYYKYKLVLENASTCTSPASNVLSVYVLPPLTPAIMGNNIVCASNQTSTTFTVGGLNANTNFTYTYQWKRAGVNVPNAQGGNTATITDVKEATAGTVQYSVDVAYSLNPSCTATKTVDVTVNPVPGAPTITIVN